MSLVCDMHTHSGFSFDGSESLLGMGEAAVKAGVQVLAATDHCDMVDDPYGIARYLRFEREREEAFSHAKEALSGRLEYLYGIEIGDPYYMADRTRRFLEYRSFDFVLGAVHTVGDQQDIYNIGCRTRPEADALFEAYFGRVERLLDFGGFDALAHVDYPLRVMQGVLPRPTVRPYERLLLPLIERLAKSGAALEISTRGCYDWQQRVGPELWVLRAFRAAGGKRVTIGSDSHDLDHVGAGFGQARALLLQAGYGSYTVYRKRMPEQIPLSDPQ